MTTIIATQPQEPEMPYEARVIQGLNSVPKLLVLLALDPDEPRSYLEVGAEIRRQFGVYIHTARIKSFLKTTLEQGDLLEEEDGLYISSEEGEEIGKPVAAYGVGFSAVEELPLSLTLGQSPLRRARILRAIGEGATTPYLIKKSIGRVDTTIKHHLDALERVEAVEVERNGSRIAWTNEYRWVEGEVPDLDNPFSEWLHDYKVGTIQRAGKALGIKRAQIVSEGLNGLVEDGRATMTREAISRQRIFRGPQFDLVYGLFDDYGLGDVWDTEIIDTGNAMLASPNFPSLAKPAFDVCTLPFVSRSKDARSEAVLIETMRPYSDPDLGGVSQEELSQVTGWSQAKVAYTLRKLRRAGDAKRHRQGRYVFHLLTARHMNNGD